MLQCSLRCSTRRAVLDVSLNVVQNASRKKLRRQTDTAGPNIVESIIPDDNSVAADSRGSTVQRDASNMTLSDRLVLKCSFSLVRWPIWTVEVST